MIEIGLQAWTLRRHFGNLDASILNEFASFDFLELAGSGPNHIGHLADSIKESPLRVKGAHIGPLSLSTDQAASLVREYVASFPDLEWVAFYLSPDDLKDYRTLASRRQIMEKYSMRLLEYFHAVGGSTTPQTPSGTSLGQTKRPLFVYHAFTPDYLPIIETINGTSVFVPAFEGLAKWILIQTDHFFSVKSGFQLRKWLSDRISADPQARNRYHSLHLSGITWDLNGTEMTNFRHTEILGGSDMCATENRLLIDLAKHHGIKLIVELDTPPPSNTTALNSLGHINRFLAGDSQ